MFTSWVTVFGVVPEFGYFWRSSAQAPATAGADCEVPDSVPRMLPGHAEVIAEPAANSSSVLLMFEKVERRPVTSSIDPTPTVLARQAGGETPSFHPELPAEAMVAMPTSFNFFTASK